MLLPSTGLAVALSQLLLSLSFISALIIPDPFNLPEAQAPALPDAGRIGNEPIRAQLTNATGPSNEGNIFCRHALPDRPPTTVAGCRSTLNSLREYKDYKRAQTFFMAPPGGRGYPRQPSEPPYSITLPEGDCFIIVSTTNQQISGSFSWREVRSVATEIIEFCQAWGGRGGRSSIGLPSHRTDQSGWYVFVYGKIAETVSSSAAVGASATLMAESVE